MTAAAAARDTKQYGAVPVPALIKAPVAAAAVLFQGAIAALDAAGAMVPGSASSALKVIGRVRSPGFDNSTGASGDLTGEAERGVFYWTNDGTNPVVAADRLGLCYVVDDQTVSRSSANGARPVAGRVLDVDSGLGVAVQMGTEFADDAGAEQGGTVVSVPLNLASITPDGAVVARFTPGYPFRIVKATESVTIPATTAAKLATLTPAIAGTPTTGGAVALTSANQTPIGAKVNGSAITALNEGGAADEVTVVASGVTAFVEGAGVLYLTIVPL